MVNKVKKEVTSSTLLTIAVTLLTIGINLLDSGNIGPGILCILVGFGVICITVLLIERGIIEKVQKRFYRGG